jgi:hypothetical protein
MMRAFRGWFVIAATALAGCGGSPGAYRPSDDAARKALDQALATWQKGGKPDGVGPSVHVADGQWESGAALDGYEVLGPDEGGTDAQAWFKVVLKLKKPSGEKPARYVVVGKQDVWVYREEDYKKFMDMADDPKPAAKKRR